MSKNRISRRKLFIATDLHKRDSCSSDEQESTNEQVSSPVRAEGLEAEGQLPSEAAPLPLLLQSQLAACPTQGDFGDSFVAGKLGQVFPSAAAVCQDGFQEILGGGNGELLTLGGGAGRCQF